MIGNHKVVAIIPARGGSKGIKNKNIADLLGKPLIAFTIEAAKKSAYIDNVVVSTDSERIASIAKKYGAFVPFLRPASIAGDAAKVSDAILHILEGLEHLGENYHSFILLQPTSPLRTTDDINRALELYEKSGFRGLCSVSEVTDHPILIRTVDSEGNCAKLLNLDSTVRRQDMSKYYRVNGAIYIHRCSNFEADSSLNDNPIAYVMKKINSIDIDEPLDFEIAKLFFSLQPT